MIILKSETYEIRMKILKVRNYKVSNAVVIEFDNKENAIKCASYFNKIRGIHAECDNISVLIYTKDTDTIKIGIYFVNKKDNPVIIKIYRY